MRTDVPATVPSTVADIPELRTEESSPPKPAWRRPGPMLVLLVGIVSLTISVLQFVGGIDQLMGPGYVPAETIASEIQGSSPGGPVVCSEDLVAEVGATTACSVLAGTDTVTVRATVTAVDGDDVYYDIEAY